MSIFIFWRSKVVRHKNHAVLSEYCMYLASHRNIHKRKKFKWIQNWLGRFWFLSLRRQTFVVGCFQIRHRLLSKARQAFFFSWLFLLPFDCSLFSFCTERADTFFKAVNSRIQYKFWYSQFFLSIACTGAALSLISQPTCLASTTEEETSLRHPLSLSHS